MSSILVTSALVMVGAAISFFYSTAFPCTKTSNLVATPISVVLALIFYFGFGSPLAGFLFAGCAVAFSFSALHPGTQVENGINVAVAIILALICYLVSGIV